MKETKPVYTAQFFHIQLRKIRMFRNYKYQAELSNAMHVSRQVYSLWEKGERKPDMVQLAELINLLEIDVNYFFIQDADPKDFDFNTDNYKARIKKNFSAEIENTFKLMPFVETIVSRQLFKVLDKCKNKKGIYAINTFEDSGITRAIQQYILLNPDIADIVEDVNLTADTLDHLGNYILLVFDNADRLPEEIIKKIINSFAREFIGSIILVGTNIKHTLQSLNFLERITSAYATDCITTDDFNSVVRAAIPGAVDAVINLLRMESGVSLKNLHEILKKIYEQCTKNSEFTISTGSILDLCK